MQKWWLLSGLLASGLSFAAPASVMVTQRATVPEDEKWVIEGVAPADCRVCTADMYISGGMEVGAESSIGIYGDFEVVIRNQSYGKITLLPNTKLSLGDTRDSIRVTKLPK